MKDITDKVIEILHQKQKTFFASQTTQSTAFRIEKLRALKKEINRREKDIYEAQILDSDEKPESEKREKSADEADSQLLEQFNELGKQISSEKKP